MQRCLSFADEKAVCTEDYSLNRMSIVLRSPAMICTTSRCCTGPLCHACTPGPSTAHPAVPGQPRALQRRAVLSLGAALLAATRLPQPARADGLAEQPVADVEVRHMCGSHALDVVYLPLQALPAPGAVLSGRFSGRTTPEGEILGPLSLVGACEDAYTPVNRAHHPVQGMAAQAYANRDFKETVQLLTDLIAREPDSPRWYEMRAQASLC